MLRPDREYRASAPDLLILSPCARGPDSGARFEAVKKPLRPFTRAREETRESRRMADLFLNTGWVLGSKTT